jgi:hypothetical protein
MRKLLTILNAMIKHDQPWVHDVKKPVGELVNVAVI